MDFGWLMLRRALAGEARRRVKLRTDGWVDPLNFDRLHVRGFALRVLTGNLSNLAVDPFIRDQFEVGHLCVESNAILTAASHVDHQ